MYNYVIKNGRVYDPLKGFMENRDIYIENGRLKESFPGPECQVIDAKGCYVAPGFIDYHVHYFKGGAENGVNADAASFPCGVTTAVDAGTCGASSYEIFQKAVIDRSDVRLLAQLLVASGGQLTSRDTENLDPELMDVKRIKELFRTYPNTLTGLKIRLSANIASPETAKASLKKAVELGEELGCNLVVHITDPAMNLEKMASILRKGDVICHAYQNKGKETILDRNKNVREGILRARERGVLFDACNGKNNFDLKVAQTAIEQGFYPDIISSDVNTVSYYQGVLHSLPRVLSKYLTFGMSLEHILDAAVLMPARLIGREDLASLKPGTEADLVIFKVEEREITYRDWTDGINELKGHEIIVPQMTIKGGNVVYSQVYFG